MVGRLIRWGLLIGVIVLIGVALFRPATLFGVDADALANSLGGEVHHAQAKCIAGGAGQWRCGLSGGTVSGVEYALTTHQYGCWSATKIGQTGTAAAAAAAPAQVSGCIGLTDMFGD